VRRRRKGFSRRNSSWQLNYEVSISCVNIIFDDDDGDDLHTKARML